MLKSGLFDPACLIKTGRIKKPWFVEVAPLQHAQVIVWVLIGPLKKNRPWVQAVKGTEIVTKTLWSGASTPEAGLNVICPGMLVKANQWRSLVLLARESTLAVQT
jgi:hypothetical protein